MTLQSATSPAPSAAQTWLRRILLLGPAWYILALAFVIASRFNYRFELEWMEGGSLIEVLRLLDGKPLYVAPSLSYIPYIYPPLYYYLAALAVKLTGIHWFTPLRLVSIGASIGSLILIYRIVVQSTSSRYWGVIAAGLFAASFRIGGAWFDIARVDMLFIFLLLAGTSALVSKGRFSTIVAGVLFALGFYAKQTLLLPVIAIVIYLLLVRGWRAALGFVVAFAAVSIPLFLVENGFSSGWYAYYVFHLPTLHRIPQPAWLAVFAEAAQLVGLVVVAFVVGYLPLIIAPRAELRGNIGLLGLITFSAIAISVTGNAQPGGYENASLPALATIPILAGLGGYWLESRPGLKNRGLVLTCLCALLMIQFAALYYSVRAQIPTSADARAGEKLVASIAATPGEVLVPYHGYLALMAGKEPSAHQVMLWLMRGNFGRRDVAIWTGLQAQINSALENQHYQRILLDRPDDVWANVRLYYDETKIAYPHLDDFYPVTGGRGRPNLDYAPK
jgi:hypothetical protein